LASPRWLRLVCTACWRNRKTSWPVHSELRSN